MTAKITDLEGRLGAAMKRADKKKVTRMPGMKDEFARALMIALARAGKICAEQQDKLFVKGADWQEGYVAGTRAAVRIVADMAKAEIPNLALAYSGDAVAAMESRAGIAKAEAGL